MEGGSQEHGEEKLVAVARQIAQSLDRNDFMPDDIINIFSTIDGRFSHDKFETPSDRTLVANLNRRISRYLSSDTPIWSDPADSSAFLDAIDELLSTLPHMTSKLAADLVNSAMVQLGEEFRLLMERGPESLRRSTRRGRFGSPGDVSSDQDDDDENIPVANPLTDLDVLVDPFPPSTVADLQEISKRMVPAGFHKDCSHAYSVSRRDFLEESMSRLGLEKLTCEDIQKMAWDDVEYHIDIWIRATPVVLRILFPSERRLCDRVFLEYPKVASQSFVGTCRSAAFQILSFADAVAIGGKAPERLFCVLDLLEAMRDLLPYFEANFSDESCIYLRNEALSVWKRLADAVRGIFMELESLIRRDPAKTPPSCGSVHPITRYVLNYLRKAAGEYRETLEQVFEEGEAIMYSLSMRMQWIMELLENNLETKSEMYGDRALRWVFMLNNATYILKKVEEGDLGLLLGDEWLMKHKSKVKHFLSAYIKTSWAKILNLLGAESGGGMKEKLKQFNSQFEETCVVQSQWSAYDEHLRKRLTMSIADLVLSPYESFLARFHNSPEVGMHAERYIRYGLEDVEIKIGKLFQGGSESSGGLRN